MITPAFLRNPLQSPVAARWLLLVFTGAAFLIRVTGLTGQSLWRDEIDILHLSKAPLRELVPLLLLEGHNGPLFFVLFRPWRYLAGISEFSLRYPSALLGTLAVPLGYVLARQLGFSRRAGLLLGLLLATSPYLVWYGQEAKMYTLLLVLVTLANVAYLKALAGRGARWWGVFIAATTVSFYIHILAPLALLVYGITALFYPARLRRHWPGWLFSLACLTLPYLPLAAWQVPLWLKGAPTGHPFYPLGQQIEILLKLYTYGLVFFGGWPMVLLFVFLTLCGLFLAGRAEMAGRLVLAAWVVLPTLGVYLISLRVPVFEDRYLIYITPPFYLLVALGLSQVRPHLPLLAGLGLGLILTVNAVGLWQQQRQPHKADFRAAAGYLARQPRPPETIMVHIPYLRDTLTYYYRGEPTLLEGLWTNDGKSEAVVNAEMARLTAGLTDLWLVVSEEGLWDSRGMTRTWLNTHAEVIDEAHFQQVDVYHYRFLPGTISTQAPLAPPD